MEEKNRLIPADEKELQDPENLIKNTEADTEGIVDFMHEEIKKRPMNRRKLLRRHYGNDPAQEPCILFGNTKIKHSVRIFMPEKSIKEVS